jgi:hypothetical protein
MVDKEYHRYMKDFDINNNPYNTNDYEEGEGTFRKHKLKDKKMQIRKGYYLNSYTYELEEVNDQLWKKKSICSIADSCDNDN